MIENISVVIIVKNGAKTLKKTLNSLQEFSDIVVYENDSTDATLEIARNYINVNLQQGDFLGFGATKNKAATYAKNDWILSLDSDEVLSPEIIQNLQATQLKKDCVYTLLRHNYYQQKHIQHCWGNDVITRLYNKTQTQFSFKKVHEKIEDKGLKIKPLEGILKHYPYTTITDFIHKLDIYSSAFALDNVGKKSSSPLKAVLDGGFSFFKTYVLKRGFLDGYAGLVIAFSHMATNFYKYIKLYELNQSKR